MPGLWDACRVDWQWFLATATAQNAAMALLAVLQLLGGHAALGSGVVLKAVVEYGWRFS